MIQLLVFALVSGLLVSSVTSEEAENQDLPEHQDSPPYPPHPKSPQYPHNPQLPQHPQLPKLPSYPAPQYPASYPDPQYPASYPEPQYPASYPDPQKPLSYPEPQYPASYPDPQKPLSYPEPQYPASYPDPQKPLSYPEPQYPASYPDPQKPLSYPEPQYPPPYPDPQKPLSYPEPQYPASYPDPHKPPSYPEPQKPYPPPQNTYPPKHNTYPPPQNTYPPQPDYTNIKCWTEWFDRDDPSGTGDWETLAQLRYENPGKICPHPVQIEVTTTSGGTLPTGNVIASSDTITGFVCKNSDQPHYKPPCYDYRVRFSCHPPFCASSGVCWTKWFDRDDPSGTGDWETLSNLHEENPGVICAQPLYIESVVVGSNAPAWGQNFLYYNPTQGFVCRNQDQGGQYCHDYKVRFGCPCGCSSGCK